MPATKKMPTAARLTAKPRTTADTADATAARTTHALLTVMTLTADLARRLAPHAGRGRLSHVRADGLAALAYVLDDINADFQGVGHWPLGLPEAAYADLAADPAATCRALAAEFDRIAGAA